MILRVYVLLLPLTLFRIIEKIHGHGLMRTPPGRSSMWRDGYQTPPNYMDNEVSCPRGGQCAPCGDDLKQSQPRKNENGGYYNKKKTIVAQFKEGQEIAVTMLITANHRGWVQFSLCELKNESAVETEDCFSPLTVNEDADRRPFWGDDLSTKFKVPEGVTGSMDVKVQLPKGKSCDHCVLRWFYSTGNDWNDNGCIEECEQNGGNKKQCCYGFNKFPERFYSCADIFIGEKIDSGYAGKSTVAPVQITTEKENTGSTGILPSVTETCADGSYTADASSCCHFFQCANGRPIRHHCPAGLVFKATARVCDYPSKEDGANCDCLKS